jgi:hypothetical protein
LEDKLEIEGQDIINSPSASDVEKALASLDMNGPGFCILTKSNGSYVQTAGTKVGLLVEYRQIQGDSFKHFVFGHPDGERTPTSVRYRSGSLQLLRNEVLLVNEAREIFIMFLAFGQIPERWNLRDITDNFE